MKKFVACWFTVALFVTLIASVRASVEVEANITRDFKIVFKLANIETTIYENIKTNGLMTEDTVPRAIWENFVNKGLFGLEYFSNSINFNDTTRSIHSTFSLRGPSIMNSTIDRAASVETFRMNTEWRKFYLNITGGFSFNFTQILVTPLSEWTEETVEKITSFSYSNLTAGVSCLFKLPNYASNIIAIGETIIFDAPFEPPWEDKLINSPILILIGLAIVGVIVFAYRKIR